MNVNKPHIHNVIILIHVHVGLQRHTAGIIIIIPNSCAI